MYSFMREHMCLLQSVYAYVYGWIDGGETEGEELSIGFKLCR